MTHIHMFHSKAHAPHSYHHQHFQSPLQTSSAAAGGQNPQYPHLRDALRLPGAVSHSGSPSLNPSVGGGGGVNVNVTDVAWSLAQPFVVDGILGSRDNSNTSNRSLRGDSIGAVKGTRRSSNYVGDPYDYEEALSSPDGNESEKHHDQHYPPFIKRVHQGAREQRRIFAGECRDPSWLPPLGDTSVVAAAGSNGVVVAWSAEALLEDSTSNPSSENSGGGLGGGLFHVRKSDVGGSVTSAASAGQPEAAFLAHSRAVNRLAWHPTGRRPYLLLTGGQDGTVKLWDRRATSSNLSVGTGSVGSNAPIMPSTFNLSTKNWFEGLGFGGLKSVPNATLPSSNAMARTAIWHCVSTFQPKCDAVRDVKWNPYIDDGELSSGLKTLVDWSFC